MNQSKKLPFTARCGRSALDPLGKWHLKRPDPIGAASRRAALRLLDAVLRKGLPLEAALDGATRELERSDDRAFAHAMAAETLRRLTDLDALIDSATTRPLPADAKARFALRLALVQALRFDTPQHAAIATVLPLVEGGPRRLVHGVFGALMRQVAHLPEPPSLPAAVRTRWREAWGEDIVAAAARAIAVPPPLDLTFAPATHRISRGAACARPSAPRHAAPPSPD